MLSWETIFAQKGINFSETSCDFGTISEGGGKVKHQFIISNNSDKPLLIKNITSSCGCTTPQWTKKPIESGKTGTIDVTYNPLGRIGSFFKVVSVYTNQAVAPLSLTIKGVVVTAEKAKLILPPSMQDYPFTFGNYSLKSKILSFGSLDINESKTLKLEAFNRSEQAISQKVKNLPKNLTVAFNPETIPAKTVAAIEVTLDTKDIGTYGNFSGEFYVIADGISIPMTYSATIIDNFDKWTATKKENAGRVTPNTSEINFGNFASGNTRTLKLTNSGKSILHIRNIQPSNHLISITPTILNINPDETAEIKVSINSKGMKSDLKSVLTIISDDYRKPILEIIITADLK
jgi:hypothetical protein